VVLNNKLEQNLIFAIELDLALIAHNSVEVGVCSLEKEDAGIQLPRHTER